jgi:hypothetical protein
MGRPLSGKTAPVGRKSLIERFGGTVSEPTPKTVKSKTVNKKTNLKKTIVKSAPVKKAPAPVAGTRSGAEARAKALASNEEKLKKARATLASKKK